MRSLVFALVLCLAVASASADRSRAKTLDTAIECDSSTLATLATERAAYQATVDAQNTIIDEAAAAIQANQLVMDGYMDTVSTKRVELRSRNIALATLTADYSDVVDAYKSKLTSLRSLFTSLASVTSADAALKLKVSPLKKLIKESAAATAATVLKQHEKIALALSTSVETEAATEAKIKADLENIDTSLVTNEDELLNELSDSELSEVDSDLGSSDLGSDSTVSDSDTTPAALFKKLRNAVRADITALKETHATAQAAFVASKADIYEAVESAKTAISTAAAAAAQLGVTNAEKQAEIVAAVAAGSAAEDGIVANIKARATYIRRCGSS